MALKSRGIKGQPLFTSVNVVTAAGNHVIVNAATTIIKKTSGAATQVTLPVPGATSGQRVAVKDGKGDSATNNITVVGSNAATIDGAANYILATNYASVTFEWNGTEWGVVAATQAGSSGGITGSLSLTSASANALAVGLAGATNPAFNVDASTATSATGWNVKSAAAASGAALSVLSSGTNESGTIDAKGTGTLTINGVGGTGAVQFGGAASGNNATGLKVTPNAAASGLALAVVSTSSNESATVDAKGTGTLTLQSVATGAVIIGPTGALVMGGTLTSGGLATNYIQVGTAGPKIYSGSGSPSISGVVQGSLYLCTNGSSTSTRLYVATSTSAWAAVTTAS